MKIQVVDIQWHRNGVSGVGFYAILFDCEEGRMVATLYDERGFCSVLRVADLSDPARGVKFGLNSWRGDYYESNLRQAVESWQTSGRLGLFSIPFVEQVT